MEHTTIRNNLLMYVVKYYLIYLQVWKRLNLKWVLCGLSLQLRLYQANH